ncbi:MAG: endonuclease III [Alphaproteobacteria bacterium]|nr:endonuclease III [Alphaproteobacteria bacterium]
MRSKKEILEIMEIFEKENPNPECELNFCNAYTLLVAVILSAQATDKGVNKATKELFKKVDSPQKMLELGEEGLKKHIKSIGLFNNKAKNIILMSKELVTKYLGNVPDNREQLESLAGVGRKTANIVLNVWYKKPALAVDTHVMRISHRLNFSKSKTPTAIELDLLKVLPDRYIINANHWLVLFGRYICKAKKPECHNCKIAKYCNSTDKIL